MWPYIQQETQGAALDQVHSLPAKALPCLSMPRNIAAIIVKSDPSSTPEANTLSDLTIQKYRLTSCTSRAMTRVI